MHFDGIHEQISTDWNNVVNMTTDAQSDATPEPTIFDMILNGLSYEYGRRNIREHEGKVIDVGVGDQVVKVYCYRDYAVATCNVTDEDGNYLEFDADDIGSYALELARLPLVQPSIFSPDGKTCYAHHSQLINFECATSPNRLTSVIEYLLMAASYSSYCWSIRKDVEPSDDE